MRLTRMLRPGLAAFFATCLLAGTAQAATLTINSTRAAWDVTDNVVGLQGDGTDSIAWGRPHPEGGGRQSGYRFLGAAAGTNTQAGQIVSLGTFIHNNFAIRQGRNLTSAALGFDVDLSFDLGGPLHQEALSFAWQFNHWETPNNQRPICADGNANGLGANVNGCGDRVTFSGLADLVQTFTYAEGIVTLQVLGFSPTPNFWTVEDRVNSTELAALFTFTPVPVPIPAAGWLLLGGLGGLAARRRRR